MPAPTALIYLRLSVDRTGEAESIDRQEAWARKEAKRRGFTVSEVFTERDRSASKPGTRPVFFALLERVQAGGIQHVLAWRSDRLWRHIQDQQAFITLASLAGLESLVTSEGETRIGHEDDEFTSSLNALLGGRESRATAKRVALYEASLAASGAPHAGGYRPFGYEPDKVTLRPVEADAIRAAYTMVLRGETLYAVARTWNERGLHAHRKTPFRNSDVRKILLAPRYAGLRSHRGEVLGAATWPPVVQRDTWERVRALILSRGTGKRVAPARVHLLASMLRCPCGASLVSAQGAASRPGTFRYRCPCAGRGHVTVCAPEAEAACVAALFEAIGTRELQQAVRDDLARGSDAEVSEVMETIESARARLSELADMFADGEIDRGSFARMRARTEGRLNGAELRLRALRATTELPSLAVLRASWDYLTVDESRTMLRAVFERFDVLPGRRGVKVFDVSRIVPVLLDAPLIEAP